MACFQETHQWATTHALTMCSFRSVSYLKRVAIHITGWRVVAILVCRDLEVWLQDVVVHAGLIFAAMVGELLPIFCEVATPFISSTYIPTGPQQAEEALLISNCLGTLSRVVGAANSLLSV